MLLSGPFFSKYIFIAGIKLYIKFTNIFLLGLIILKVKILK